jgi:hypothetical protein
MSLSSAKFLKDSGQRPRHFNTETGWTEVNNGLRLVIFGYYTLIGGAVLSSLLWLLTAPGVADPVIGPKGAEAMLLLDMVAWALTAVCSYTLVLMGQWRCLQHAPQRENAKEVMLICFTSVVICSGLSLVGSILGAEDISAALRLGADGLDRLNFRSTGALLLAGSALLGLVASLVFSQFLRNVACCFGDERRARHVDFNLTFIGLLLGCSVGVAVCFWEVTPRVTLLPVLAIGWLFCFAWHLVLIHSIRGCIGKGLRNLSGLHKAVKPQGGSGRVRTLSLSGLRRLLDSPPS